ncbi:hypothetical protein CEXT_296201 [Caerostris extrusa]|uniref:Uncharacterized protein n=1 Tax=Caerostris extrusa TaxID=172846 RepID=A0AAV4RPY0_CAEEX|nr:hypothetical protein CEXT_296201 [Caerostris extrusa]
MASCLQMLYSSDDICSPSVLSLSTDSDMAMALFCTEDSTWSTSSTPGSSPWPSRPDRGSSAPARQAQGQGSPSPPQPHSDSSSPPKVSHLFYGPIRFRTIGISTTIAAAVGLAPESHVKRL